MTDFEKYLKSHQQKQKTSKPQSFVKRHSLQTKRNQFLKNVPQKQKNLWNINAFRTSYSMF